MEQAVQQRFARIEEDVDALRRDHSSHDKDDAAFHSETRSRQDTLERDMYGNGQPGFIAETRKEILELKTLIAKYAGVGLGISFLVGLLSHILEKLW